MGARPVAGAQLELGERRERRPVHHLVAALIRALELGDDQRSRAVELPQVEQGDAEQEARPEVKRERVERTLDLDRSLQQCDPAGSAARRLEVTQHREGASALRIVVGLLGAASAS